MATPVRFFVAYGYINLCAATLHNRPPHFQPTMNEEHQTVSTIPHPQAGEQLPKSNRLWYPDGNLLINADGKSCLVYKWILMMHCPELGAQITKLTLERPKNVRVVLLMDEPTVLSEYFLRALYDAR